MNFSLALDTSEHSSSANGRDREDFDTIARIAREDAGLSIPPEKAPMVFARLTKRLRALGISDRSEYCRLVQTPDGAEERRKLICTLTTNVTGFFREAHHFEMIATEILPQLAVRARQGDRVRFWSAGCSSGQEPYTLAMVVLDAIPEARDLDVRILATDIDTDILAMAKRAEYDEMALAPLSPVMRKKFVHETSERGKLGLAQDVRQLVSFRELNLLGKWPMRGPFDLILCRNVVIYFDQVTQNALWPRFESVCAPGGHLFLGHSERIDQDNAGRFQPVATTTYRRADVCSSPSPNNKD